MSLGRSEFILGGSLRFSGEIDQLGIGWERKAQLSSQMVMFTILKPFTVHATEECKHLQVRKMSTPAVRWLPVQ